MFGSDTLYSDTTVLAVDEGDDVDVGIVTLSIGGTNQRGEIVARIVCRLEIYRHGRHPEDDPEAEPAGEDRFRLYHPGADNALVEQTGLAFEDMAEGESSFALAWPHARFRGEPAARFAFS